MKSENSEIKDRLSNSDDVGLKFVISLWVAAWILQFIGHGVFEGRAPALLDSLDQVFNDFIMKTC